MSIGTLPLTRFTVLDLTHARAGPTAVRQLADWGANVIKIEPPASDGERRDRLAARRLRLSEPAPQQARLTLNLKSEEGIAIFMQLAEKADVIVENIRSTVKHRLGVDYET